MTDPRYFWMEARQNWRLQNAKGALKDLGYLSKNILHWDQYYTMPLLDMRDQARRVAEAGIAGYVVAFEPGFATASVYGDRVPFPVDLIPYRLTRFAYREFTWNPQISWSEFKARVHKKFSAPPMSGDLVDIIITLRDLMQNCSGPVEQLIGLLLLGRVAGKSHCPTVLYHPVDCLQDCIGRDLAVSFGHILVFRSPT